MPRVRPEDVLVIQERLDGARPRWRGVLHQAMAFLTPLLGIGLVAIADGSQARLGAAAFVLGLTVLFGTSAAYHRIDWSTRWALVMKRADHVAILVALAGTYTPFALVVLDGWTRTAVLAASWAAVALGVGAAALGLFEVRGVAITAYITLGWMAVLMVPQLSRALSTSEFAFVVLGGVLYTGGAIGLALRWPDPDPEVFGFHEVWHVYTVLGAAAHAVAVAGVVT